jgi:hypothetical protein
MTPQQIQTLKSENTALRRELDMLRASYDSARQTNEVLKAKCRHDKYWAVYDGYLLWCYECGAIRSMTRLKSDSNTFGPDGPWIKPVGKGGKNPAL